MAAGGAPQADRYPSGYPVDALAWTVGATIFANYLETFATYVSTYAGLASIMAAIVFLYIVAAIFIIGAEINAAIIRYWEGEAANVSDLSRGQRLGVAMNIPTNWNGVSVSPNSA